MTSNDLLREDADNVVKKSPWLKLPVWHISYIIACMCPVKVETIFRLECEGAFLQPTLFLCLIFEFGSWWGRVRPEKGFGSIYCWSTCFIDYILEKELSCIFPWDAGFLFNCPFLVVWWLPTRSVPESGYDDYICSLLHVYLLFDISPLIISL